MGFVIGKSSQLMLKVGESGRQSLTLKTICANVQRLMLYNTNLCRCSGKQGNCGQSSLYKNDKFCNYLLPEICIVYIPIGISIHFP